MPDDDFSIDDAPEYLIFEDNQYYVNPDAPDEFKHWAEENPTLLQSTVEFAFTAAAAGHSVEEYSIGDSKDLAEYHYSKVDEAVEDGDIEEAQNHQNLAKAFEKTHKKYRRAILDDGDEGT